MFTHTLQRKHSLPSWIRWYTRNHHSWWLQFKRNIQCPYRKDQHGCNKSGYLHDLLGRYCLQLLQIPLIHSDPWIWRDQLYTWWNLLTGQKALNERASVRVRCCSPFHFLITTSTENFETFSVLKRPHKVLTHSALTPALQIEIRTTKGPHWVASRSIYCPWTWLSSTADKFLHPHRHAQFTSASFRHRRLVSFSTHILKLWRRRRTKLDPVVISRISSDFEGASPCVFEPRGEDGKLNSEKKWLTTPWSTIARLHSREARRKPWISHQTVTPQPIGVLCVIRRQLCAQISWDSKAESVQLTLRGWPTIAQISTIQRIGSLRKISWTSPRHTAAFTLGLSSRSF